MIRTKFYVSMHVAADIVFTRLVVADWSNKAECIENK